jgi:NAD-dependent dihydropyrimidine dehydrogenase PreA subunit
LGHLTSRTYQQLHRRLDQSPQGAPESPTLFRILETLLTEQEASLVSVLPINLFTVDEAATLLNRPVDDTKASLDTLADKGIVFDFADGRHQIYLLAPTMAGFFEFSLMRLDGRFDQRLLSELYYQYINNEPDFIRRIFALEPSIFRAFFHEDIVDERDNIAVLDYERASHVIDSATCITVGTCYCRHKLHHLGKVCGKPLEVCLTFNRSAESLSRHGIARQIGQSEAHMILRQCRELGLVQLGDNIQEGVNWICNCCACCCEALVAYRKLGYNARITTNFVSVPGREACMGCGICEEQCPVEAVRLGTDDNGNHRVTIDEGRCIGCGVCVRFCSTGSLTMVRRKQTAFVPKDSFERIIVNAVTSGKLANLLFDNYTAWTHNVMRRFLGIFLSMEPAKRLLAREQIRSRFLSALTGTEHYTLFGRLYYNSGRKPDYSHPELRRAIPSDRV